MIGSLGRIALIATVLLWEAGCTFHTSPAEGLRFTAPADWKPSPGILGMMQFWRPPQKDGEVLMLLKSPAKLKAGDIFSNDRFHGTVQGATVIRRQSFDICGTQPATYAEARGTSSQGRPSFVYALVTDVAGSTYVAMYVRPVESAPNPMALAALREVCAKP